MKRIFLVFPLLLFFHSAYANKPYDSLLVKLDNVLDNKAAFDRDKTSRIEKLELSLNNNSDVNNHYNIYLQLYDEYKSFNYDKAFYYAQKLQQTGYLLKDQA